MSAAIAASEHPLRVVKYAQASFVVLTGWQDRLDVRYHKPSFPHNLERDKTASSPWSCKVCKKRWENKPRAINCIGLPQIGWEEAKKTSLIRLCKAASENLRLKPGAIPVAYFDYTRLDPLHDLWFEPSAFEAACDYLPPIVERTVNGSDTLKTMDELRDLDLRPRPGSVPGGCRQMTTLSDGKTRWRLLYRLVDCIQGYESAYITKTRLMKTYGLSDGWMKSLGRPDIELDNPHNPKGPAMQLFQRERVEQFLADRSTEYADWLIERKKRVAIASKVAAKTQMAKARNREQTRLCVGCDSACLFDRGFWCAVHPAGWMEGVPQTFYCPDYQPRRSDRRD